MSGAESVGDMWRADHLITGQNHASVRQVTDMIIEDTSFGVRLTP